MATNYVECGYVEAGYFEDSCGGVESVVRVFGFSKKLVINTKNAIEAEGIKNRANKRYGRNAFTFPKTVETFVPPSGD